MSTQILDGYNLLISLLIVIGYQLIATFIRKDIRRRANASRCQCKEAPADGAKDEGCIQLPAREEPFVVVVEESLRAMLVLHRPKRPPKAGALLL